MSKQFPDRIGYSPRSEKNKQAIREARKEVKEITNNRKDSWVSAVDFLISLGSEKLQKLNENEKQSRINKEEAIN